MIQDESMQMVNIKVEEGHFSFPKPPAPAQKLTWARSYGCHKLRPWNFNYRSLLMHKTNMHEFYTKFLRNSEVYHYPNMFDSSHKYFSHPLDQKIKLLHVRSMVESKISKSNL